MYHYSGKKGVGMEVYKRRVRAVQEELSRLNMDLMVLFPSSNMKYLSGFYDEPGERMLFLIVPPDGEPIFLVPELYERQVMQASPLSNVRAWKDSESSRALLKEALASVAKNPAKVLIDDGMWASFFMMLQEVLPDSGFSLASSIMRTLRMMKTSEEVNLLRKAGALADEAYKALIGTSIKGITEITLAARIEETMRVNGADGVAFETLVASGPHSALPHYRAGQRRTERGDVVVLDYGCRLGGYCSDITRTVVCGEPSEEVRKVYEIVLEAQETAVHGIRPGIEAQMVDRIARGVIEKSGYGASFIHRTGHGIGIDVHEDPYIVEGNQLLLQEGISFSVEPGIYLPGRFGVRIEDIVVVTKNGTERMNRAPRDLQILG